MAEATGDARAIDVVCIFFLKKNNKFVDVLKYWHKFYLTVLCKASGKFFFIPTFSMICKASFSAMLISIGNKLF